MWYEELPESCPPNDAVPPAHSVYYRMCVGNPANESDFLSQRKLNPDAVYNAPECIARALSVFTDMTECADLLKLPAHKGKGKVVASVVLNKDSGVVKKTGRQKSHYSWWRAKDFCPLQFVAIVHEEKQ